jgi:hypothetical protein
MDFKELLQRIAGRPVIIDENVGMNSLKQFLTNNGVRWRQFRKGVTDEDIMRHMLTGEVVVTGDRRFAFKLGERAILVPLAKSDYHQISQLMKAFGKNDNAFNDIGTCPICTSDQAVNDFDYWDIDHMKRHIKRPYVAIGKGKKR